MVSDRREDHIFQTYGLEGGYPIEVRARASMAARQAESEQEAINEIRRVLHSWEESLYYGDVCGLA